jgi:hypothetical protein
MSNGGHPIYIVWQNMRCRCENPTDKSFPNYGGRGIRVCERWQVFENFRDDMLGTYQPALQIERVNNHGNYEPSNCRWASRKEECRNRRSNVLIDTPWGRVTVAEAAERSGVGYTTVLRRVHAGWAPDRLLELPDDNRLIPTPWGSLTVTEAACRSGVHPRTLATRVALGWHEDRLFKQVPASRLIETPWGLLTVAEAAKRSGVGYVTLRLRLRVGWPADRLFMPPLPQRPLRPREPDTA